MKKKILIILAILFFCTACGKPFSLKDTAGQEISYKKVSEDYLQYLKGYEDNPDNRFFTVKRRYLRKIGIFYANLLTITIEKTDLFLNYRTINAQDTLDQSFQYGQHIVNVTYYLYDSFFIDSDKNEEYDISGLTARFYIEIDDLYISGLSSYYDLDQYYESFDYISNEYLEPMDDEIIQVLDNYTCLNDI